MTSNKVNNALNIREAILEGDIVRLERYEDEWLALVGDSRIVAGSSAADVLRTLSMICEMGARS